MGLLRWILGRNTEGDQRLREWRRAWDAAARAPNQEEVAHLRVKLDAIALPEDDIEIEREMLAGLDELAKLEAVVASTGLPVIDTGHRVVGSDACHFMAPVSMPDEPSQPSGRLFLTAARAIFAGGAKATTLPWHAVSEVLQQTRDVVLVRHDRETLYRFRCNAFADAMCAAFLARALATRIRSGRSTSTPRG
jgi:hypothetical protein